MEQVTTKDNHYTEIARYVCMIWMNVYAQICRYICAINVISRNNYRNWKSKILTQNNNLRQLKFSKNIKIIKWISKRDDERKQHSPLLIILPISSTVLTKYKKQIRTYIPRRSLLKSLNTINKLCICRTCVYL